MARHRVQTPGNRLGWLLAGELTVSLHMGKNSLPFTMVARITLKNYEEEKRAFAVSSDLRRWECLTPAGPMLTSPHGSGSLRYIDAQLADGPRNAKPGTLSVVFMNLPRPDNRPRFTCCHCFLLESLIDAQNRAINENPSVRPARS